MHFPDSAWIKMSAVTLDELLEFKSRARAADLGRHAGRAAVFGGDDSDEARL